MLFKITIETEPIPEDSWGPALEELLETLGGNPEALGVLGWGTAPNALGAIFEIEGEDAGVAADLGRDIFVSTIEQIGRNGHAARSGFDPPGLRRIEVIPSEEADSEDGTALLGATDVARVIGLTRQRVYQLLEEDDTFPRPAAVTARGQLWNRIDMAHWVALHGGAKGTAGNVKKTRVRGSSPRPVRARS